MTPRHHPDASSLLAYAAGSLPQAFSVVVASHLAVCASCRAQVARAESVGAGLIARCGTRADASPAESRRDALRERLLAHGKPQRPALADVAEPAPVDALPAALQPLFAPTYAQVAWRTIAPGMAMARAEVSGAAQLMLLRIAPGRSLPLHSHGQNEMTMILRGAYDDVLGHFAPGDVADLDMHTQHQPVTSPGAPCICVAATDAPLRFSGWMARLLQPLVRI